MAGHEPRPPHPHRHATEGRLDTCCRSCCRIRYAHPNARKPAAVARGCARAWVAARCLAVVPLAGLGLNPALAQGSAMAPLLPPCPAVGWAALRAARAAGAAAVVPHQAVPAAGSAAAGAGSRRQQLQTRCRGRQGWAERWLGRPPECWAWAGGWSWRAGPEEWRPRLVGCWAAAAGWVRPPATAAAACPPKPPRPPRAGPLASPGTGLEAGTAAGAAAAAAADSEAAATPQYPGPFPRSWPALRLAGPMAAAAAAGACGAAACRRWRQAWWALRGRRCQARAAAAAGLPQHPVTPLGTVRPLPAPGRRRRRRCRCCRLRTGRVPTPAWLAAAVGGGEEEAQRDAAARASGRAGLRTRRQSPAAASPLQERLLGPARTRLSSMAPVSNPMCT